MFTSLSVKLRNQIWFRFVLFHTWTVSVFWTREALTLLLDTFHNEAESFLLSEVTCH